jgi:hypothetical protein
MPRFLDVDPRTLYLPTQRQSGADPWKLQLQIARFGASTAGMPPVWVEEDPNGALRIVHGVTRAVRATKMAPGALIRVEVIATRKRPFNTRLTVADVIP